MRRCLFSVFHKFSLSPSFPVLNCIVHNSSKRWQRDNFNNGDLFRYNFRANDAGSSPTRAIRLGLFRFLRPQQQLSEQRTNGNCRSLHSYMSPSTSRISSPIARVIKIKCEKILIRLTHSFKSDLLTCHMISLVQLSENF